MYAPVLRSIPTRYSRAGRLSSMPLRLCSQVKFVSQPRGATATRSRSSLVLADGAGVCAQASATTSARAPIIPHRMPRQTHLCIIPPSYASRCQPDVLEVGEVAGDHPWKHICCDILGVHGRLSEQPEHWHMRELGELMIPYLAQQPGSF